MVKLANITASNISFASQHHEGRVCVFAGATSGIGFGTLLRMVTMLDSSTFYILGRSPSQFASRLDELRTLAPSSKFVFVETQVSLISGIDSACEQITSAEQRVDYLCMSPGGMPFQGAVGMGHLYFSVCFQKGFWPS
jgi:NADP-dependent 3-hydroxy acid dehydrogenase YdfG